MPLEKRKVLAFDIEVFKNFFSATFINVRDLSDTHVFVIGFGRNDQGELRRFLRQQMTLVGYNSISYDNPVLRFLQTTDAEDINGALYKLSLNLIKDEMRSDKKILTLRYPKSWDNPFMWSGLDLMAMMGFDKLGISLKQIAINLKWHKIQDLPIEYDHPVHATQQDMVLDYNKNDVLITIRLYEAVAKYIELREALSETYGVSLLSASKSKIANILLSKFYPEQTGIPLEQLKELRTERSVIRARDCFAPFVSFEHPVLQNFFNRLSSMTLSPSNGYKYKETLQFGGVEMVFGVGGLHSKDAPGKYVSDEKYVIMDGDVTSYYPNLLINNGWYPEHLSQEFIILLKRITEERIAAKNSGDNVKAEGLKIAINSIFGKTGSPTFWLYDPLQMLRTTLTGQMGLVMLVEGFYSKGIKVLSCNTDGVVCKIERSKLPEYYEVCDAWMKKTGLVLEYTTYAKYIRRDVNSYITEKDTNKKDKIKAKGAFVTTVELEKSYRMPIVAKCLSEYFLNGIPVEQTLRASRDIFDFCLSRKSAPKFGIYLDVKGKRQHLQKTNRFFISKNGGRLITKDNESGRETKIISDGWVTILNDYDESIPFEDYQVDYTYYMREVRKFLDAIEPATLFNLQDMEPGKKTKMDFGNSPAEEEVEPEDEYNVDEPEDFDFASIIALSKKEQQEKIEKIVQLGLTVYNVDPRFAYVISIKKNVVTLYSFGKGSRVSIEVDAGALKAQPLSQGTIIYCTRFSKPNGSKHVLMEYSREEKFVEKHPTLF